MTDPESSFQTALCSVSVHANSVWWSDNTDPYRLANFNLWVDCLNNSVPTSQDHQPAHLYNRRGFCEEGEDPPREQPGWSREQRRSPPSQLAESVYDSRDPFKIKTVDELKLCRRTTKESVRNIWAKPEPGLQRKKDPLLNANVPEFYPSVVFHHVDYLMPLQTYQPVPEHSYQTELFPYIEQGAEHEGQWQHPQLQAFPRSSTSQVPEWYGRPGTCAMPNLVLLQRTQRQATRPVMQQASTAGYYPSRYAGPLGPLSQYHHHQPLQQQHQQIILSADFPELPNNRDKPLGGGVPELRPHPAQETLSAARTLEGLARRMSRITGQEPTALAAAASRQLQSEEAEVSLQGCCEPRRLYRDVLASKSEEDSQTTIDGKYEELEREALEQYVSSEDSEVVVGRNNEQDAYQDLERQAEEQYDDMPRKTPGRAERGAPPTDPQPTSEEGDVLQAARSTSEAATEPGRPRNSSADGRSEPCRPPDTLSPVRCGPSGRTQTEIVFISSKYRCEDDPVIGGDMKVVVPIEEKLDMEGDASALEGIREPPLGCSPQTQDLEESGNPSEPDEPAKGQGGSCGMELPVAGVEVAGRVAGRSPKTKSERPETASRRSSSWKSREGKPSTGAPSRPATSHKQRRQRNRQARLAMDGHCSPSPLAGEEDAEETQEGKHDMLRPTSSLFYNSGELEGARNQKGSKKSSRCLKPKSEVLTNKNLRSEIDAKTLLMRLKIRALVYLKTVDMKLVMEEKQVVRELLYGDDKGKEKIRNRVRISDIEAAEVFRAYVKEMATITKLTTEMMYRRIRRDVLEMKTIHMVQPTCAEKRKIRNLIKRCLQLNDKAEELSAERKLLKKQYESLKKEVHDVLNTIHKTTEVVYCLRGMCRDTLEQLESGKSILTGLVLGRELGEPQRSRGLAEYRLLLLYLAGPRAGGLLFDRKMARLQQGHSTVYAFHRDLHCNHTLLSSLHTNNDFSVVQIRFVSSLRAGVLPSKEDLWDERNWKRELVVGNYKFPVDVEVEGCSDYVCDPEAVRDSIFNAHKEVNKDSNGIERKMNNKSKEEHTERCSRCAIC